jgi:hypothetical protein
VVDQSSSRTSAPMSPPPANQSRAGSASKVGLDSGMVVSQAQAHLRNAL